MREIPLSQGKTALVDDCNFEALSKIKWHAKQHGKTFYAEAWQVNESGERKRVLMHRLILGVKDVKILVDHADNNGLNNQGENIRVATRSQNAMNRSATAKSKSGIKGVSWSRNKNKWAAYITGGGKSRFIGYFDCKVDAGKAYDIKAKEYFGEFAWTNF